jgi:hypothetical protein
MQPIRRPTGVLSQEPLPLDKNGKPVKDISVIQTATVKQPSSDSGIASILIP